MADSDELTGLGDVVGTPQTHNAFSGSADVVVQGGSFGGGVHVHIPEAAPQSLVPRHLPSPPSPFVNQAGPLSILNSIAAEGADSAVRLVLLSGLPGSGRKALARHWAWTARPRFSGGQILIDFAAFANRQGHAAAGDAATACLRALGVADRYVPPTLSERFNLLRTHTSTKPVLMVLENVTEPAMAAQFMPGAAGSVVLVISANRVGDLHVDGANLVEPERLGEADAIQLFAARCGQERVDADIESARRIVGLCDGLPLAVRIAAARAATSRRMTLARLADELTDERRRLDGLTLSEDRSMSMAFNVSYRALSADVAQFYLRLGVSPLRDFTVEQAAVAGGVTAEVADRLLDELDSAYLIEVDLAGRCRLPDLVRLHAAERAAEESSPDDRREIVRRVVEWLLVRALFADRAVMESDRRSFARTAAQVLLDGVADPFSGDDAKEVALAWLDGERANLIAAVRAAAEYGLPDRVWQLAETLTALYFNRRYVADWVESSRLGVEAAENCGRPDVQVRLLIGVSRADTDRGELALAQAKLDQAMTLAETYGQLWLQASVWEFRGRYLDHLDELFRMLSR